MEFREVLQKLSQIFELFEKISIPSCTRSDLLKLENLIIDLIHDGLGVTVDEGRHWVESYEDLKPSARVFMLMKYGSREKIEEALKDGEKYEIDEVEYVKYIEDGDAKVSENEWKMFMKCIAEFLRERALG